MSDNVRRDNRRALPKYLLTILLFGLLGGVLGFFTGVAGAAGVAETVRQALDRVLAVCAPWGIVGSAVVLLGAGWYLYAAAKRRFAAWDGEDEDAMDAAEQQLSWALLLTGLVIILDFFFFAASIIYDRFLPDLILFLASVAALVVLQQIEGNLIYPHVVGSSVGLPSIWVLAAVTLGGKLMGITGMLFFIPLCSVIYALFRSYVKNRLVSKAVPPEKWRDPPPPPSRQ